MNSPRAPAESKFALVGEVCPNTECAYYGRRDGYVVKFGQSRQGRQRYRCHNCNKCFSERTGTVFYGKRKPETMNLEVLAGDGGRDADTPARESGD
jgi:transposase-like protein